MTAARAAPDRLTYSSGGIGTTHHVSAAMLAQQAGLAVTHVPYRGAPQGILAVQTGEVDFAFYNISTVLAGIRAGQLRALAVTSADRSPLLAEIATMRAQGFPDYEMTTWFAVAVPKATPETVLQRLYVTTRAMLDDPAVQRRLAELGFERVAPLTSGETEALVREEHARWGPVLRAAGARLE